MKVRISLVVVLTTLVAATWAWGDGFNDVSWPLIVPDTHPQAVFADSMGEGCQLAGAKRLTGSDYVTNWDGSNWVTCWYKSTDVPPVWKFEGVYQMGIEPDKMYRIVIRTAHDPVTLTMTGAVSDTNRIIPILPGPSQNWVGTCFAVPCSISGLSGDDADLLASGFTGAKRLTGSDNMNYFDGLSYFTAWYQSTATPPVWKFEGDLSKASILLPGRGYILAVRSGHAFINNRWVYGVPPDYSKASKAVLSSKTRVAPAQKAISKVSKRLRSTTRSPSTIKRLAPPEKAVESRRKR